MNFESSNYEIRLIGNSGIRNWLWVVQINSFLFNSDFSLLEKGTDRFLKSFFAHL